MPGFTIYIRRSVGSEITILATINCIDFEEDKIKIMDTCVRPMCKTGCNRHANSVKNLPQFLMLLCLCCIFVFYQRYSLTFLSYYSILRHKVLFAFLSLLPTYVSRSITFSSKSSFSSSTLVTRARTSRQLFPYSLFSDVLKDIRMQDEYELFQASATIFSTGRPYKIHSKNLPLRSQY